MNHDLYQRRNRPYPQLWGAVRLIMVCALLWGCGLKWGTVVPRPIDLSWTERAITAEELLELEKADPALTSAACQEILARLNHKDRSYIRQDIQKSKVLKVPNDFRSYLSWSPMPARLGPAADQPQLILLVKDIAFLGWYENGELIGDTYACIGKKKKWTRAGSYKVLDKDKDHVSSSYRSALGYPALMPFALRIYGTVWIHGGDVIGANCSHGCINLPLDAAEQLYFWANTGAAVLVVESFDDLRV